MGAKLVSIPERMEASYDLFEYPPLNRSRSAKKEV
jgi:hypothetical protein